MGAVRFSCPPELVSALATAGGIEAAVETGTYKAEGTLALRDSVSRVFTIELDDVLYSRAVSRYGEREGITFVKGSSDVEMKKILADLDEPAIFWLDAHGGMVDHLNEEVFDPAGDATQCPTEAELRAISEYAHAERSCILIDDARGFLGPLPAHRQDDWPTLVDLVDMLRLDRRRYITILDDVIIAVPRDLRPVIDRWWLDQVTDREGRDAQQQQLWEAYNPSPRKALRLLVKSLTPNSVRRAYDRRR